MAGPESFESPPERGRSRLCSGQSLHASGSDSGAEAGVSQGREPLVGLGRIVPEPTEINSCARNRGQRNGTEPEAVVFGEMFQRPGCRVSAARLEQQTPKAQIPDGLLPLDAHGVQPLQLALDLLELGGGAHLAALEGHERRLGVYKKPILCVQAGGGCWGCDLAPTSARCYAT